VRKSIESRSFAQLYAFSMFGGAGRFGYAASPLVAFVFFFAFLICFRNPWQMSRIRRIFPQCNKIVPSHLQGGL